jgi:hypothetical protein
MERKKKTSAILSLIQLKASNIFYARQATRLAGIILNHSHDIEIHPLAASRSL